MFRGLLPSIQVSTTWDSHSQHSSVWAKHGSFAKVQPPGSASRTTALPKRSKATQTSVSTRRHSYLRLNLFENLGLYTKAQPPSPMKELRKLCEVKHIHAHPKDSMKIVYWRAFKSKIEHLGSPNTDVFSLLTTSFLLMAQVSWKPRLTCKSAAVKSNQRARKALWG